jgi:hypothetical protein
MTVQQSNNCENILSQMSSQLRRILYTYRALYYPGFECVLFRIHHLLGLSWDELRASICPLHRILGNDTARLRELIAFNGGDTLFGSLDYDSLLLELAKGCLRAIEAMIDGEMHWAILV